MDGVRRGAHRTRQSRALALGAGRPLRRARPVTWCACRRRIRTTTSTTRPTSRPSGPGWTPTRANVFPVGRNGMHRYNNQDHSMYTAMLTVENLLGADHDVWSVNVEEEYHEVDEGSRTAGRARSRRGRGGTLRSCPRGLPGPDGPGRPDGRERSDRIATGRARNGGPARVRSGRGRRRWAGRPDQLTAGGTAAGRPPGGRRPGHG